MVNDTYSITLQTPMGREQGLLTLQEKDGMLSGSIQTKGRVNRFDAGRCAVSEHGGMRFSFQGILSLGFIKIPYTARGTVQGDTLKAVADTRFGSFPFQGKRRNG